MSLLEVKNLSVAFKGNGGLVNAISDISFSLEASKTLALVGESGSGKSVTSLCLMQLLQKNAANISGEILFENRNLLAATETEMQNLRGNKISMVFQEPMSSLNPVQTCGAQVLENILQHNYDKKYSRESAVKKVLELFDEVQLPSPERIYKSYPHEISGGQKQRVMIAMAISCSPTLLIADEPTTALDVTVQKQILELLKSLQQKHGMAIVFISHDLGVVADIADDIGVLFKGNLIEKNTAKNIFTHPQHKYTQALLQCKPTLNTGKNKLVTVEDLLNNDASRDVENEFEVDNTAPKYLEKKVLLQVENLSTHFSSRISFFSKNKNIVKAVDDVSFTINTGETIGIVGESGCGKTTLGRSILRLVEPTTGNIIFSGINLMQLGKIEMREMRKKMQLIFQDPYSSLNPKITIGNAIIEPMLVHKIYDSKPKCYAKMVSLLERVGLTETHASRYPHEFSGGQRQRIVIARALAMNPQFIICDESVAALDVSVQAQVLNLLNELKRDFQFSYMFITHDLAVAKYMSDYILVMNKGKIEEQGNAEELFLNPQKEYTKKLIDAIPVVPY